LSTYYFDTRQAYRLLLVQNRHTKYCLCTKYHLRYNYKNKVLFRYLLKSHGAHREIYKTTGVSIGKKNVVLNFKAFFLKKKKKIMGKYIGVAQPPPFGLEVGQPPPLGLGVAKPPPWPATPIIFFP
jgi:hypothetical protein